MSSSCTFVHCFFKTILKYLLFFSAKLLLPDQDRFSRNANHHDHNHHHHDHDHDPESILGMKLYFLKNDICLCLFFLISVISCKRHLILLSRILSLIYFFLLFHFRSSFSIWPSSCWWQRSGRSKWSGQWSRFLVISPWPSGKFFWIFPVKKKTKFWFHEKKLKTFFFRWWNVLEICSIQVCHLENYLQPQQNWEQQLQNQQ